MEKQFQVAVVGASGYGGAEIVRLLQTHPEAEVTVVTSGRSAGKLLRQECPWLATDLRLETFDPAALDVDAVFLCQEAGFAMAHAPNLGDKCKVIDLSADFRLKDLQVYESTYSRSHTSPDLAAEAVYGLPELVDRKSIAEAKLVANPGCYPTATLLALMPLVKAGWVAGTPVVDAKSGVSGAGRSRKETDYLFSELSGGFKAYAVTGHRHNPEIEQLVGQPIRFTPHLIPAARGLQATCHVPVNATTPEQLQALFEDAYASEPFVWVQDAPPSTKQVIGSNCCAMSVSYDARTGHAVISSVIDNLVKGAAGQAIQNMNLMLGLPEAAGLPVSGTWP